MSLLLNRNGSSNQLVETECYKQSPSKDSTERETKRVKDESSLLNRITTSLQVHLSDGFSGKEPLLPGKTEEEASLENKMKDVELVQNLSKSYTREERDKRREKIKAFEDREDLKSRSTCYMNNTNHGEINGCRPKQYTQTKDVARLRKLSFGNDNKEDKKGNRIVFGMSYLKSMIGKDPAVIVTELTQSLLILKDHVKRAGKDEEVLETFIHILAEAFTSSSTPMQMITLFDTLKQSGFFDTIDRYLVSLIIRITTGKLEGYVVAPVLKNILCIIMKQITRNPSSVYVFRKVHALLGQVIEELGKFDAVDDEIVFAYQHLTEQRKYAEREQKELADRKQEQEQKPDDDFRQYPVSPTAEEITRRICPKIRANKVDGAYEDLDDYLDVHFRLMREDFVAPLREGMTQYISMMKSNKGKIVTEESLRNLDLKVYENVRIHSPVVTQHGLCYKLQIKMTAKLRRIEWKLSKRLIYGSMVCLSDMNFHDFIVATVVEREERDIKQGFLTVHFERKDLALEEVLGKVFRMAETPGYFEAYKHVLSSLQSFKDGDLPFEDYIVGCKKETDPPAYLSAWKTYDLQPLVYPDMKVISYVDTALKVDLSAFTEPAKNLLSGGSNNTKAVRVRDIKSWPSKELLHMDGSQYEAVQNALTNEFAIIQGPPGTGKTYIGLQIVKALLQNNSAWSGFGLRKKPMLIVCYTNHALDQFLEGIVKFFRGNVLRVGGRSNSEELENFNLKKYRSKEEKKGSILCTLKYYKRRERRVMEARSRTVLFLATSIQVYQTEIVKEDVLLPEMGNKMYESLRRGLSQKFRKKDVSYICKWLEVENIQRECIKQIQNELSVPKTKHIHVEDETGRILKDRMLDTWEDLGFSRYQRGFLAIIRSDIAFFVPECKATGHKKTTVLQRKYFKLLKSTIINYISDGDIMSQEEADNVIDIWRLNRKTKWRLYRLWIQKLCAKLYIEIEEGRESFENASEAYVSASENVDKEIMRQASVIGMTTSGAARYQSVLREIGPKVVVVEEAAEVLEAHIVTTLSKSCEHLILIGDHKQLRPNPTVYKLAVRYNLDISLFERMVKNGMKFNCLELQHRMRPEISSIMRHIYPELKDHEHVKTYPNIKGVSSNLFLVNHSHLENSNSEMKSYSNENEAKYAVALCRYLLLQGYEKHQITVLTSYTGQLLCIKNLMPKEEFDGVKVTVVDNYQGEENDIVILSLVRSNSLGKIGFLKTENRICVALSRAKMGFYIVGNFDHLARHSELWERIVTDMKSKACIGEGLTLYCQNHPQDNAFVAKSQEDFKNAPEGGCKKRCNVRLNCGHQCERFCHIVDPKHETKKSRCEKACTKRCELGYKCPDKCYIECRPCPVPVLKIIPNCEHSQLVPCGTKPEDFSCQSQCELTLKCGHLCQNLCGMEHTSSCKEQVNFTWPCGHKGTIKCFEVESKPCPMPCGAVLKCGHICKGTCGTCFMGRVHKPCRVEITQVLKCGHRNETYCQNKPVCTAICENACDHNRCLKLCWELCEPCKNPCSWKCPHYRCTKLCSEVCNRPRCNKPCNKRLKCKHKCIGLCGEACPRVCRKCNSMKFESIAFGDTHKPNARFVLLENCGHLVESFAMDKYMAEVKNKSVVKFKYCPMCQTPIRKSKRYGNIIKRILQVIEQSKKGRMGNVDLYYKLQLKVEKFFFGNSIDSFIYKGIEGGSVSVEVAMTLYPCQYYKGLIKTEFKDRVKELYRGKFENECQTVSKQLSIAVEIIDLLMEIMLTKKEGKSKEEQDYISFLQTLLMNIASARNTLTAQEAEDFRTEIQRCKRYAELLKIEAQIQSNEKGKEIKSDVLIMQSLIVGNRALTHADMKEIEMGIERLSGLDVVREKAEADEKLSGELTRSCVFYCADKCNCLHKQFAVDHKSSIGRKACCAVEIEFGDFEVSSETQVANTNTNNYTEAQIEFGAIDGKVERIEALKGLASECSLDQVTFGDIDLLKLTEKEVEKAKTDGTTDGSEDDDDDFNDDDISTVSEEYEEISGDESDESNEKEIDFYDLNTIFSGEELQDVEIDDFI